MFVDSHRQNGIGVNKPFELVLDGVKQNHDTHVLDTAGCGTCTSSGPYGKNQEHPGELGP